MKKQFNILCNGELIMTSWDDDLLDEIKTWDGLEVVEADLPAKQTSGEQEKPEAPQPSQP